MDFGRRYKHKSLGKTVNKSGEKVDINFDLMSLDLMCSYVLCDVSCVRRAALVNLRNLISMLDMKYYEVHDEKMKRLDFVSKALEARLERGIYNRDMIIKYVDGGITEGDYIQHEILRELSMNEIQWMTETVSESIKYSFIYNDIDRLLDTATRFKSATYKDRGPIVKEIEILVAEMQTKFRQAKVESESEAMFGLDEDRFTNAVADVYNTVTNPSRTLISGMQGLNELIGGAFEAGRTYLFFGLTGGGKSLTLLNLLIQFKQFNKTYKPKDPTKRPVAVYLTMENSVKETVARLFDMVTGGNTRMSNYSINEVVDIMRREGELYVTDESPMDILIKFVPNNSVDTSYLYTLAENLEDEGYELAVLIQDHIKRIRPALPTGDVRIDLGNVVNEFKTFAMLKDVVVISNSHLNRNAASKIDTAKMNGTTSNSLGLLGRDNIGESMLMLDNTDAAFLLSRDEYQDGTDCMGIKRVKARFKCPPLDSIYQPFEKGTIKLVTDIGKINPAHQLDTSSPAGSKNFNNGIEEGPNGEKIIPNYTSSLVYVIPEEKDNSQKNRDELFEIRPNKKDIVSVLKADNDIKYTEKELYAMQDPYLVKFMPEFSGMKYEFTELIRFDQFDDDDDMTTVTYTDDGGNKLMNLISFNEDVA